MTLFPSYNLEIENYKDKHWSINPWFKLEGYMLQGGKVLSTHLARWN